MMVFSLGATLLDLDPLPHRKLAGASSVNYPMHNTCYSCDSDLRLGVRWYRVALSVRHSRSDTWIRPWHTALWAMAHRAGMIQI